MLRFGVGWVKAYFVGNRNRGRLAEEWRLVYGASLRCAARALSLRVQYCRRQHFKVGADPDPPEASGIQGGVYSDGDACDKSICKEEADDCLEGDA